jgi:hypothetical protein
VRTFRTIAVVTTPPLLLAVAGLFHPHLLLGSTAGRWATLHIMLLPIFPLLTAGILVPLWTRPGRDLAGFATVLAWVGAFVYATFYTGLDAVAGIAAGTEGRHSMAGADLGPLVFPLFHIGDRLGYVGSYALAIAIVATSVAVFSRHGPRTLPGSVILFAASLSFLDSHIFWPRGVFTMLGFALGFGLLAWAVTTGARAARPVTCRGCVRSPR